MKSTISSIAAMAALVGLAQSACTEISGNWYCNQVSEVTYDNFGGSGTYNRVTGMDDTTGACNFSTYSYSGSNAPFDEELSLHIRGPIQLKQFAYYTPSTSSTKAKRDQHVHEHRHSHAHAKRAAPEAEAKSVFEKRSAAPGTLLSTVSCPSSNSTTYTVDGQSFMIECGLDRSGNINMLYTLNFATCIQSCANYNGCQDVSYIPGGGGACYMKGSVLTPSYNSGVWGARLISGSSSSASSSVRPSTSSHLSISTSIRPSSSSSIHLSTSTSAAFSSSSSPTTLLTSTSPPLTSSSIRPSTSTSLRPSTSTSTSSSAPSPTSTGTTWSQQSYYSSTAGTASNIVFLNNMGGGSGTGTSGVWSSFFGSSLSYASADGTAAASSPQTLEDVLLDDDEVILFTAESCGGENAGGCGYFRPGIPAYHGFGGADKVFLIEFAMPSTGTSNMPAIWLLNALIPRTQEYGSCTCWGNTNGCGELDVFEVLSTGSTYMTSSIHGNQAGGDSDYFARPTGGTVKAAIVMQGGVLQISILPSAFVFEESMEASVVSTLMNVVGDVDSVVTLA